MNLGIVVRLGFEIVMISRARLLESRCRAIGRTLCILYYTMTPTLLVCKVSEDSCHQQSVLVHSISLVI